MVYQASSTMTINRYRSSAAVKRKSRRNCYSYFYGTPSGRCCFKRSTCYGLRRSYSCNRQSICGADTWATSSTIAAALKKLDYDVIITGRQAIDGDTAQVGPQIAEHLGIPQVSYAEEILEAAEDKLVVKRQFEDRYHVIEIKTPCLITALSELATPRYMTVHGIFDAYREKEVKVWTLEELKDTVDMANIGLKGSPTNVKQSFTKQAKGKGLYIQRSFT